MKLHQLYENRFDDDYSYGDDDRADDERKRWMSEVFSDANRELSKLKIPPNWVVWYDIDESEDEPYLIVWGEQCEDGDGGVYEQRDTDDQNPPKDWPHMGAYPIDGDSVMFYNVEQDLNLPPFDFGALHDDPEIAKQLRDRMKKKK